MKILLSNLNIYSLPDFVPFIQGYCNDNAIDLDILYEDELTGDYYVECSGTRTDISGKDIDTWMSEIPKTGYDLMISFEYAKLDHVFNAQDQIPFSLLILDIHMLGNVQEFGPSQHADENRDIVRRRLESNNIKIFSCFQPFAYLYKNIGIDPEYISWIKYPVDVTSTITRLRPVDNIYRDYVFSAGNHKRDFPTLLNAYNQLNTDTKLLVIANKELYASDFEHISNPNIIYLDAMSRGEFFSYLKDARLVVLPLKNQQDVCNGLTFLAHSFVFNKPLIITDNPTTNTHVLNGFNALVANAGDSGDLAKKMKFLLDRPEKMKYLADNGFKTVKKYFSFERLTKILFDEYKTMV